MGKPGKGKKGGGGGGGKDRGEKKSVKHGKKVFREKKQDYLKKKLVKETKKAASAQAKQQATGDTITIAWKGKQKEIDKKELAKDKKGKLLLKKITEKRVLSADEKHRLKMLGEAGDLMKLWEVLREKRRPKEEKVKAIKQILEFTEGTFLDDIRKPDMSRMFQSVLKWGTEEDRKVVHGRVKGSIGELCTTSHANQFIKSLIEYSPQLVKDEVVAELMKAGYKILSHKNALIVLEHLFNKLNAEKQNLLIVSFFDGLELKEMKGYPKLHDILSAVSPNSLEYKRIVERLYKMLSPSVSKGSFDNVIIHKLLEVLLRFGTELEINDVLDEVSKGVVNISRTKAGAACAVLITQHASPATRKVILKSFQHSVVDMCCSKSTSFFMARLFDIIDNVQFLLKTIGRELVQGMPDLVANPQGSIPLLHLLTPHPDRKKKYFTFNHYDELWNSGKTEQEALLMPALTKTYVPKPKRVCTTDPKEKHQSVLAFLLPSLTAALMADPKQAVENVISRRIVTELLHCAAVGGLNLNKSARTALQKALDERGSLKKRPLSRDEQNSGGDTKSAKATPTAAETPVPASAAKKRKIVTKKPVVKKRK